MRTALSWLLLALPAAAGDAIDAWRRDIAAPVVIVRVEAGVRADPDEPVLGGYLANPAFRRELDAAHALTLNHEDASGKRHFILLNAARSAEWRFAEEELLGHELGHVWLAARGFDAPVFAPGPLACLAVHAGDIPQHVLIRREMRRRGIGGDRYQIRNLDATLAALESGTLPELAPCQRLQFLSQWLDMRLSLPESAWPDWRRFDRAAADRYPDLARHATALEGLVRGARLSRRDGYLHALRLVRQRLETALAQRADMVLFGRQSSRQYP
ncbi:MAG: hypothetical protein IPM24_26775 [Bryobacterales bacterium]|nr:hypothetical protein [Bryobacterales bacterium]